ncbi:hypothetical protein D7X98_13625 [bacterium 1XD8-76]|nr:hypothetical protein D7X98_13625 [bacterium 1XD8-76]
MNRRKQAILSDDEIVDVLINYIDEELYNYAVMIDGEWGCGKTYFIRENLQDKLEKHEKEREEKDRENKARRVVYVSLYGVKSLEEVSKQMLMESYLAKTGKAKGILKKSAEAAGTMLPIIFDIIKPAVGVEMDSENISKAIGGFLSVKDSILIFDDLERCDCPVNEVLGYINTFVEHDGMKVIIVANQKEIGKRTYFENLELKYLVAAHENIDFEKKSNKKSLFEENAQINPINREAVHIDTVKSRLNQLFAQDVMYEKVIEKLVGITIYYQPDLQRVFSTLIENSSLSGKLQGYLNEQKYFFEEYMTGEEHSNLRTFQFFLSKINELYKVINKIDSEGQEAFFKYLIQYSFKVCVSFKNNSLKDEWEENEEYAFKSMGERDIWGNHLAFRFVDDFVTKSVLDEKTIKNMLQLFEDEYINKKGHEVDIFRQLEGSWYFSEDEEVQSKVQLIMQAIENNRYEFKEYPRIIGLFIELELAGFSRENTDIVVKMINNNISKLNSHINIKNGYALLQEGEKRKRYNEIIEEIQENIDLQFEERVSSTFDECLKLESGWGEKLEKYVYDNRVDICDSNGFLRQMDIPNLCRRIEKSGSKDINAFRGCILSLYVQGYMGKGLEMDGERVQELRNGVEGISNEKFDNIKKLQLRYLISNLVAAEQKFS